MKAIVSFMMFFLFLLYLIYITNLPHKVEGYENNKCGTNKYGTNKCGSDNLLPILNPKFNLREICKNCILLEDHLFQKRKRCKDCIKKHFLTIEALAEEAITLDKNNECREYYDLPDKIREIEKLYLKGGDVNGIAQKLRQIRKNMMDKYFEEFN